jgi:hypothetical protein
MRAGDMIVSMAEVLDAGRRRLAGLGMMGR